MKKIKQDTKKAEPSKYWFGQKIKNDCTIKKRKCKQCGTQQQLIVNTKTNQTNICHKCGTKAFIKSIKTIMHQQEIDTTLGVRENPPTKQMVNDAMNKK